jgi:hypothetical protein
MLETRRQRLHFVLSIIWMAAIVTLYFLFGEQARQHPGEVIAAFLLPLYWPVIPVVIEVWRDAVQFTIKGGRDVGQSLITLCKNAVQSVISWIDRGA